jgi:hypothetical protein
MTRPESALELARRQAALRRAAYGDPEPIRVGPPYDEIAARLSEWAVPDPSGYEIRSIRRFGTPITWFKRGLVRFLSQYHAQLISDQSRFNVLLLSYVRTLEARVHELEVALGAEAEPVEAADALEDDWA